MHILDVKEVDALAEAAVEADEADLLSMDVVGAAVEDLERVFLELGAHRGAVDGFAEEGSHTGFAGRGFERDVTKTCGGVFEGELVAFGGKDREDELGAISGGRGPGEDHMLEHLAAFGGVGGVKGLDVFEQGVDLGRRCGKVVEDCLGDEGVFVKHVVGLDLTPVGDFADALGGLGRFGVFVTRASETVGRQRHDALGFIL